MKSFKFLLLFLSVILCCGNLLSSPRSRAISVTESIGMSAVKTLVLSEKAHEFLEGIGYGVGASSILRDWQTQQWLEIESLLAQNEVM